jgi:Flp pilus assembly pilin Flp
MAPSRNGRKEPRMFDLPRRFGRGDGGGTSIEYGLIAAGIAVGVSMAAVSLGAHLKSTFANIAASPEASGAATGRPAAVKDGP